MYAEIFRHFYNYHLSENLKLWNTYITSLSYKQFTQPVDYSLGSVRDQIVHLISAEDAWFSELRGVKPLPPLAPTGLDDRPIIRAHWDEVELRMQDYLSALRDEMLFDQPIEEPEEDKDLMVWQVLFHVLNHGTDHRAQILRVLHDLGLKTISQDYIFYVYEQP